MDDAGSGLRGLRAKRSQELFDAINNAYGIDCGRQSIDLGGSSNLNLLVGHGDNRYVVRVYRPYVTADRLDDIHVVRDLLAGADVPCGGLLSTLNGSRWIVFEGRLVEAERYVEHDAEMDSWDRLERGLVLLGRMHAVLRDHNAGGAAREPIFANYVASTEALGRTLSGTDRIRGWDPSPVELQLAADADALARQLWSRERSFVGKLPRQLVHGDYWDNNIFFRQGELVFVTDFDFMGHRPRIDDLALTLYFTCMEFFELPVSDDLLMRLWALLDVYDAGTGLPLTPTEREALPFAIARQPLWSIGGWVASLDDQEAARRHAEGMPREVGWSLRLMAEVDRWQAAFKRRPPR